MGAVLELVVVAVVAVVQAIEDLDGLKRVRRCRIRRLKYSHLHQFVKLLSREPLSNQSFVTYSFVTLGTIVKGQQKNFTIFSWRAA